VLRLAALLALLVPAAAGAGHGRVQLALYAGGGLSSDLFVGAGLGRGGLLELQPEGRLDLSFSPDWKLASRLAAGYAAFTRSGFAAGSATGELEARWLRPGVEGALLAAGERLSYTTGAPLDLTTLSSPSVTGSRALRLTPLVRWPAGGAEWRLALPVAYQASSAADGREVAERDLALLAGVGASLGPWALAGSYRLQRARSDRPDFTSTSHGLFASAGRQAGPVDLQGQVQLLFLRTGARVQEQLLRASLAGSWPLGHGLWVEAVYAFAAAWSDEADRGFASRHQGTLGLRGRVEVTSW